jgi:ABC-type nickel/cobalt efflux system permease component RcnA
VKSERNIQLSAFVGLSFIYSIMHGIGNKNIINYY